MAIWLTKARTPGEAVRRILDPIREEHWWYIPIIAMAVFALIAAMRWYGEVISPESRPPPTWPLLQFCLGCKFGLLAGADMRVGCFRLVERRPVRRVLLPIAGLAAVVLPPCLMVVLSAWEAAGTAVSVPLAAFLDWGDGQVWYKLGGIAGGLAVCAWLFYENRAWDLMERLWQAPPSPEREAALRGLPKWHRIALGEEYELRDPFAWARELAALAGSGLPQMAIRLFAKGVPRYRDLPEAMAGFDSAFVITEEFAGLEGVEWLLKYVVATCGDSPVADEAERRWYALPGGG